MSLRALEALLTVLVLVLGVAVIVLVAAHVISAWALLSLVWIAAVWIGGPS